MNQLFFAEIILPLAVPGTFTYEIPVNELSKIKIGIRVSVPFGSNKLYTGIVHSIHQNKPELFKAKKIDAVLDNKPLVTTLQIKFWEWMAEYYMCTLGEVYRNAFPTALKWESETFVKLILEPDEIDENLSKHEWLIINELNRKGLLSIQEISKIIEKTSVITLVKSLWEKGIIRLNEVLKEKYTPKVELFVRVKPELKFNQELFSHSLEKLKNAERQREILLQLIVEETQSAKPIRISKFLKTKGGTHATLRTMEEKGLVEIYRLATSRITEESNETIDTKNLSTAQNKALVAIRDFFGLQKPVLLHGVTSSGKTEIYIKLIERVLQNNKTVLFLLPEISVTSQMIQRIRKFFGDHAGVYHSGFNQNERVELWNKTLNGDYKIVIGARSAMFLPFKNLGLIIVDEEHEAAYKQSDAKPYFHARDMAMVLAGQFKANVILGSATPSLETFYNAQIEKFGYVKLDQRFNDVEMPEIHLVNLRNALKNKKITDDITDELKDEIQKTVTAGKQVLIFQNRRGFAPIMECRTCGFTPYCPNCDVSLTVHKLSHLLKCHYCGHTQATITKCPNCQSPELSTKGIGTEQIELQLVKIFPHYKIARMDVDSMRKKYAYEKLLEAFEQQEIDILVGTQMIAKGLDFSNIGLVGVIRADSLLNFPEFRAHEKAFQLLTQVAGRAGRRTEQGKVLIQTFNPDHEILKSVSRYDYHQMVSNILHQRQTFFYPPYNRLILITFRHSKWEKSKKVAEQLINLLKPNFDNKHLLGPEEPSINRIRNLYIQKALIKIPPENSPKKVKALLAKSIEKLRTISAYRSVRIDVDVDPL